MKSIFRLMSLLLVTQAYAVSYECSNAEGQKLKIFQQKPEQAVAVLQTGIENQIFYGTYVYEDEFIYEITKYNLITNIGEAAPVVLSKRVINSRGGCGRGGCPDSHLSKTAQLTLNGHTKTFNCK